MDVIKKNVKDAVEFAPFFEDADLLEQSVCYGVISKQGTPIGVGVLTVEEDDDPMAALDYLLVLPDYRDYGIATAIVDEMLSDLKAKDIGILMTTFPDIDDYTDFKEFLKYRGFSFVDNVNFEEVMSKGLYQNVLERGLPDNWHLTQGFKEIGADS